MALLLQGGGALGAYQAGVYEALADSPWQPDWIAGISIGAINAALIAGNAPGARVAALRDFWESVTGHPGHMRHKMGLSRFFPEPREAGAVSALLFGQPGFFEPRPTFAWLASPLPESIYDTSALKATLERLIDFDLINDGPIRLSLGAVEIKTGNFEYFENRPRHGKPATRIRAEHVMASGALPPGFPSVEIDGRHYWDGGLVSNTPLQYVLDTDPRIDRLAFEVDVFAARGPVPTTLPEALEREKDIRYSSRTRAGVDGFKRLHDLRVAIGELWAMLPEAARESPEGRRFHELGCISSIDVVELVYRPKQQQGQSKDYAFGRDTMRERWAEGFANAGEVLRLAPWEAPFPPGLGLRRSDPLNPNKIPDEDA
ncbi:patatin-like phospholipase family protein [Plastoroseomonas arctica]|uniref:patatin-like phospholipase family protein n=1 Tax=Plastoroseomonas arctica TaxID=1509237 RepID=UPI0038D054DF